MQRRRDRDAFPRRASWRPRGPSARRRVWRFAGPPAERAMTDIARPPADTATPLTKPAAPARTGPSRKYDRSIIEGPLPSAVWKLAWPTMLANIIGGLQGIVDHVM